MLIAGTQHINRAIDGDVVAIELLPKEEWKLPSVLVREMPKENEEDSDDDEEQGNKKEVLNVVTL